MKKKLVSVVTCTLLAPMFLNGNVNPVYADNQTNQLSTAQENQEKEVDRKGLLGYYFKGKEFNHLTLFAPTRDNTLIYDQQTVDSLLDKKQQEYQSIRWIGLIQSKETGDFTFNLSDDKNAIIEIDGKTISHKGQNKQVVHLEKGKLVPIKIEYQPDQIVNRDSKIFKEFKLFKVDSKQQSHQVQLDELRNPEFNKKETQQFLEKASKTNLFTQNMKRDEDATDTDGDSIPDLWEENGYTIQNKVAVKWDDSFAAKGYTKFVSNPFDSHTVGDPYTDYEKAARDLDLANAKETFNPLVAAFPSVNVNLEKVILSPNEDLSNSVESHSSTNWSYTNTEGVSIEAGSGPLGISYGVSANYQHSETVAKEWGTSTGNTSQFNTASAGYLNANVRYNNVGTGAIYEVKPTTGFVLDNDTVATITAKSNSTALSISPGESYPKKGQNGIAINTMDDFNSHPITLNKQQLDQIFNNKPLMLETNQADGVYKIKDTSGNIVTGGEWNGVIQQIQAKTASIIVDTGEGVSEKRVAAKDYDNPEDKTPSLSLKEALKLGYPEEIKEKDGLLYYNDKPIYESSVMTYLDENTAKEVKEQLNDITGKFKDVKQLFDVKLTPKMNFTIKLATLYDGAEDGSSPTDVGISSPLGEWAFKPDINNVEGGNTGKRQYQLSKNKDGYYYGMLALSPEVSNKLKKNYQYYISMSIKADAVVEPTVTVMDNLNCIVDKKLKLSSNGYQRFDILVDNSESHPINVMVIDLGVSSQDYNNYSKNIYIDDITITEVSAMKVKN
ncbi:binary toxin-like calcium binding domain-containing protein [Brevibacillus laterosporus]|uniref:binary toxin-like calcium binding domain-containing protein n=1 Tax=Brevibacillus laterosporus TaxID=1465 RepID=UPI003D1B045A